MQDVYNALASKVYDVMQAYAELHGYTLVLDVSQQQSPVLYAATANNITKDIIDAYNQKSGIPAPPPAPLELVWMRPSPPRTPRFSSGCPGSSLEDGRKRSLSLEHESLAGRGFRAAMAGQPQAIKMRMD